ncbi:hypothetical protein BSKO_01729 [Bryopsis sp. KO-2023]|nr:hypothetical protein BSKO_01729 [Bryopsis sp. KO-2023]
MVRRPNMNVSMTLVLFLTFFLALLGESRGDVVLSQVVEGSSYNKALVITNRGPNAVNLADYVLKISFNEKPWRNVKSPLSDKVLEGGKSLAICHGRFDESHKGLCNEFDSSISFNGNDAIALERGGKLVDVFGVEKGAGMDGTKGYTIKGVKDASWHHTLVREPGVKEGVADWKIGVQQWEVLPKDVFVKDDGTRVALANAPSPPKAPQTPEPRPAPAPSSKPPAGGKPGSTVRMGSFNVEFLFDGINDHKPSPYVNKPKEAEKHFERVRSYIQSLKPDFLHLCEVEDKAILDRMARGVGLRGQFVQGTDSYTGQDVALLSKEDPKNMFRSRGRADTPIPDSTCGFGGTGNTGISKNYVAKFDRSKFFPFKFAMVGLHLKAFPVDAKSCAQREGQAEIVQGVVADLIGEGYEVAVLGDLNDFSGKTPDIKGDKPRSSVLEMLRNPDLPRDRVDDLRNVMELIPQKERYSAWWDRDRDGRLDGARELSQIDHILLTKGLWDLVESAWVDHSAPPGAVSDHWPVMVEFRVAGNDDAGVLWIRVWLIFAVALISGAMFL